jgi:hypothetical protein
MSAVIKLQENGAATAAGTALVPARLVISDPGAMQIAIITGTTADNMRDINEAERVI